MESLGREDIERRVLLAPRALGCPAAVCTNALTNLGAFSRLPGAV